MDIHKESLEALVAKNKGRERIFTRGTGMCRGVRNEAGDPVLQRIGERALQSELLDSALYVGRSRRGEPQPANPPKAALITILGSPKHPFPQLRGLVQAPVLRADGTILLKPGYDKDTQLLYIPAAGLEVPGVSDSPDAEEVRRAVEILEEPFSQFPFEDEASRANTHGLNLTGFVQRLVDDIRPMAVVNAAQTRTGKSLLVDACAGISTGRDSTKTRFRKDEEMEKKLDELLFRATPFIQIDNAKGRIESATLESILTSRRHADRIFGTNDQGFDVPQEAVWALSGNNLELGSELGDRSYPILLDAKHPHPGDRKGPREGEVFRNLPLWVRAHRGDLIWAVLTLCRAWWVKGRPDPGLPPFGGFEEWQTVVGGILAVAGAEGFLSNRRVFRERHDQERHEIEVFLRAVLAVCGDAPFTCKDLARQIEAREGLRDTVPDDVEGSWQRFSQQPKSRALGNYLSRLRGRRVANDGLRVEEAGDDRNKVKLWRVVID